jgi:hypothetical protein
MTVRVRLLLSLGALVVGAGAVIVVILLGRSVLG